MNVPFFTKKPALPELTFGVPITVKDIVAPPSIETTQGYLKLGERLAKSFFVFSFPRYLSTAWTSPIVNLDTPLDVALFVYPADVGEVLRQLRKRVAEVQSEIMDREEKGLVRDPELETAYRDLEELRDRLQTAQEKMFHVGVYITIYGKTEQELKEIETTLRSILEARLVYIKPALFQQKEGFVTTCPYGLDLLQVYTPMNTAPLSSMFPFISFDLSSNEGILYGINKHNNSLVLFDRFALENANLTVFGVAGGGKTSHRDTQVLIRKEGEVEMVKIGTLVDDLAKKYGTSRIEEEIEGVLSPPGLDIYSFNKQGKTMWSKVTVAMRKKAPRYYYKILTRSGREIITTKDHNMVILADGKIKTAKTEDIKNGQYVPLPRCIHIPQIKSSPPWRTNELVVLCGLITAEGNVYDSSIYISNSDPEVLGIIKSCLERLGGKYNLQYKKDRSIRGIYVKNDWLVNEIVKLGGKGLSSKDKRVLPFIFDADKKQVAQYLAAYFEGDGAVEQGKSKVLITATSKSKGLISDICYLLYYFGIIGRISKTRKKAKGWKKKKIYWRLTISGREHLERFAKEIGFLTENKNRKLADALARDFNGNTNVDIIPDLQNIIRELYELFPPLFWGLSEIRAWKTGGWNSSPQHLLRFINEVAERVKQFRDKTSTYRALGELPVLNDIIDIAKNDREPNRAMWQVLGQSWRVVKNEGIRPRWINANKMMEIAAGKRYELTQIKNLVHAGFKEMDLSIKNYNRSLAAALVDLPESNTRYDILQEAAKYVWRNYKKILDEKIPEIEKKLIHLYALAKADLFWDEIVEIKKFKNTKDKYVYDLTVDNEVFLAGTGGMFVHNSYAVKLEILRSMMMGADVVVIDPEHEYEFLRDAVGGSYLKISLGSPHRINPFDLPQPTEDESPEDILRSNIINLVGLIRIMLGGLTPEEDAIIDRAITETYAVRDITPETDPKFWPDKIPMMSDLEDILSTMEGAESLLRRLQKFTQGTFAGFFNQPTNINMDKQLVIFGIRDMEESLRPMAMYVVMRYIWNAIRREFKKRIMVIDEAWWLMQTEDGASFLYGLAKRGRKYWLGLTTVTQDVIDFLKSDYGKPIINNSALRLLMKQSTAAAELVTKTFGLTEAERNFLLETPVGEGLFFAGQKHVAVRVMASYAEDQIITTAPEEVAKIRQAKKQLIGS